MKILFVGDLVGEPGLSLFQKHHAQLKEKYKLDATLVNGENVAPDGRGITPALATSLFEQGASLITTGNHIWAKKEIVDYIGTEKRLLRPANFPGDCPGSGVGFASINGTKLAVINLMGRVFMHDHLDCPFRTVQSLLTYVQAQTRCILVDFHAETTSEKAALGYFLDGKVSAVVGTHTHVQTADERILPGGTAFITDVGMGGALNSSLGTKKEPVIKRFVTQMPTRFSVETEGPMVLSAVIITIDETTGRATAIERLRIVDF